ncbi:MAG: GtrA family protein [Deltaproteobacteria bacterium]|nr:GtrA family protein [Deltaproteobacteria bacterium]
MWFKNSFSTFKKYTSVGILNTAIHWGVFATVYTVMKDQSISNLIGFLVAVTFSFHINAGWTFNSSMTFKKYLSMVTFMATLSWLIGKLADYTDFSPIVTLVLFSGISLVLGYLFSKHFIFRGTR